MPPSSTCMSEDLLFFDTFSHSNDKDNFDLVQFPSPVIIDLIKIVPLGQPVEAKIPGNVRLGATNPSKCELEFFINDLTKQDAHTMTDLGKFYCNEKDTDFNPPLQIQTDGLLLRGSYRTLTLAVFGQIAVYDEKPEDEQAILSAQSPPAQTPASPVASERDISFIVDQELIRNLKREEEEDDEGEEVVEDEEEEEEESFEGELTMRTNELMKEGSPVTDNMEINEQVTMAMMDEIQSKHEVNDIEETSNIDGMLSGNSFEMRDKKDQEMAFSNSSDLDNCSTRRSNKDDHQAKQSLETGDNTEGGKQSPNDYLADHGAKEWYTDMEFYIQKPLVYFPDPTLTLQERTLLAHKSKLAHRNINESIDKEVEKVKEMFDVLGCSEDSKTEDWVTLVEDLTNDITNMSLCQTVSNEDMLRFLVKQVLHGLDLDLALRQKQTGFKVRHLKAGIKLATILFHCGVSAVTVSLEAGTLQQVLELYNQEQMSLPLKLLIFKCLSTACDTVAGVEHIIHHKYYWKDSSLAFERAKKHILDSSDPNEDLGSFNEEEPLTCYQYMILILLSQPTTRVTIAIGNLIKKIRFYQNLLHLKQLSFDKSDGDDSEDSVFESDRVLEQVTDSSKLDKSIQIIQDLIFLMKVGCFNISQPVRYLPAKVQFHVKPSPADNYLAIYKWIRHFRTIETLNLLLDISRKNISDIEQSVKVQSHCLSLIQLILDTPKGTQLFLSNGCFDSTMDLIKTLRQKTESAKPFNLRMSGIENLPDASLCREESIAAACCRDMSLRLSYCFRVFSCIDKLFEFHRELIGKRDDSALVHDPEKVLHQLYIMSEHPYGLSAIMKHFSCIGNLDCILRFLDVSDYQKHLEFVKETSIDYVLELVGTFFRLNNNVLEISEEYLDTLLDLCKTKDKNLSVRIKSLLPWLTPFDSEQPFPLITYSEETFRQLTRVLRKCIPDCSIPFAQGLNFELPPQMITAVRILRQLCIPPQVESFIESNFDVFSMHRTTTSTNAKSTSFLPFVDSLPHQQNHNQSWNLNLQTSRISFALSSFQDESLSDQIGQLANLSKLFQPYDETICGDLKYHYGIMQVFEQEGLRRLLNTLRELTGNYPKPIHQTAALSGFRGRIVISYINSVVTLLHSITCHLIDARGKEFKDTSMIPVVLETYSLLCFVPKPDCDKVSESMQRGEISALEKSITLQLDNYQLAQKTKKLILSILLSYTQMCLSVSESEENVISKSMWTKMLKEVIEFTLSTPVFFHHGLDVLTKILPAPLPCASVLDSIDQEQLFKNINHRKLWSAHLHPLHQKLELMISNMSLCHNSQLRALLYYLCNQLCDLSSNAACMVAKILSDTLIACAAKLSTESNGDNQTTEFQNPAQIARRSEDRSGYHITLSGTKESKFAVRMVLNLLSSLITNQAFETAFSNHLQVLSKKDEKLLANLQNIVKSQDDSARTHEMSEGTSVGISVTSLIESLRSMAEQSTKDNNYGSAVAVSDVSPPEELTKINLIEMARKTSDRFNLPTSIAKTYRLKVLLDMNSRAHRINESSSSKRFERPAPYNYQELLVPSSHKTYVPPPRGRNRSSARPDSFRSRPQNTSRPPSIHVDDFIDLYGNNSAGQAGGPSGRYSSTGGGSGGGGSGSGSGSKNFESQWKNVRRAAK